MESNRDLYTPYSTVSFRMTLSDLEWLSKIFDETKHRAASLRKQNYRVLVTYPLKGWRCDAGLLEPANRRSLTLPYNNVPDDAEFAISLDKTVGTDVELKGITGASPAFWSIGGHSRASVGSFKIMPPHKQTTEGSLSYHGAWSESHFSFLLML